MRTKLQQQTITFLRKIGKKDSVPPNVYSGLCYNIECETGSIIRHTFSDYYEVVKQWKYFSGSYAYPVPPSKTEVCSGAACRAYGNDMWSGTYGDMRRMFARYLAREFSKRYPK